jgi:hypothetical protein
MYPKFGAGPANFSNFSGLAVVDPQPVQDSPNEGSALRRRSGRARRAATVPYTVSKRFSLQRTPLPVLQPGSRLLFAKISSRQRLAADEDSWVLRQQFSFWQCLRWFPSSGLGTSPKVHCCQAAPVEPSCLSRAPHGQYPKSGDGHGLTMVPCAMFSMELTLDRQGRRR